MGNTDGSHHHEHAKVKYVYGSGVFGNIKYVMKKTCNAMLIIFITILSSTDLLNKSKIGRGQPTIDIFEKASIRASLGMTSRLSVRRCLFVNEVCINKN